MTDKLNNGILNIIKHNVAETIGEILTVPIYYHIMSLTKYSQIISTSSETRLLKFMQSASISNLGKKLNFVCEIQERTYRGSQHCYGG